MRSAFRSCCPIIFIIAASCSSLENKNAVDYSVVASVDGIDENLHARVRSVLQRSDIDCYMEGSIRCAVMVPKNSLEKARMALLAEPNLGGGLVIVDSMGEMEFTAPVQRSPAKGR